MLGNLCLVMDGGAGDWNEISEEDVEGISAFGAETEASSVLSVRVFSIISLDVDGAGTKNFALAPPIGLTDGTDGENDINEFPPPWLKVSTYLFETPMDKC